MGSENTCLWDVIIKWSLNNLQVVEIGNNELIPRKNLNQVIENTNGML
jgi:hypothetical protein